MSEIRLRIIPAKAKIKVNRATLDSAQKTLSTIFIGSEIAINYFAGVQFIDCGSNFEYVSCPYCKSKIDNNMWHKMMEDDWNNGNFKREKYLLPCCQRDVVLDELLYHFDCGFSSWEISISNLDTNINNISMIENSLKDLLGFPFKIVICKL